MRTCHRVLFRRSVFIAVACTVTESVQGQGQGTHAKYAPLVVQLPASVRAQGAGGAWTAGRDADAVFYNPANAGQNGFNVGGGRFGDASNFGHLSHGFSFGASGISLGVAWLDYGTTPVPCLTCSPGSTGDTWIPWRSLGTRGTEDGLSAVAVAAGYLTFKGIRWGSAIKLLTERIANSHDATAGFDFGAAKEFGRYSYGVSVQNVGSTLDVRGVRMYMPTRYTIGSNAGGFTAGPFDVAGGLSLGVRRDGYVLPAGGLEVSYNWLEGYLWAVRVGAARPEAESINPFTLGASMGLDRFILDYSVADLRAPVRGVVHQFGVRVR